MQSNLVKLFFCAAAAVLTLSACSEGDSSGPQNPPASGQEARVIQDSHIDWAIKFVNARFKTSATSQVPRALKVALAGAFTSEALNRMDFTEPDITHPINQIQLQRIFNKIQERHL